MKEKEGDKLAAWCNEVINDENENIKGFARGILRRAAFRIFKQFTKYGFTYSINNPSFLRYCQTVEILHTLRLA